MPVFLFQLGPQLMLTEIANLNMLRTYQSTNTKDSLPRILHCCIYKTTTLLDLSLTKFAAHKQKEANKQALCFQRQAEHQRERQQQPNDQLIQAAELT
jgi:hypothetical protein